MRALVIVLVILGALGVAVDYVLKRLAEGGVATELASSFELPEAPEVTIEGWPFMPRFLAGEVPALDVRAERAEAQEVVLHDIEMHITDLSFDTGEVIRGEVDAVRTGGGQGTAVLRESEVERALERVADGVDVTFSDGRVEVESDLGSFSEEFAIEDGRLVVGGGDVLAAEIHLPTLGGRVRYDAWRVTGRNVTVELVLQPGRIARR